MTNCPVCHGELDDGYCHSCEHDVYEEPEWFLNKYAVTIEKQTSEIQRLHESIRILNNRIAAFESEKV